MDLESDQGWTTGYVLQHHGGELPKAYQIAVNEILAEPATTSATPLWSACG